MSLSDVKHQVFAQRLLQQAMNGARVPHAYIFHGPSGVGKEMLARGLAQRLLCERPVTKILAGQDANDVGLAELQEGCGQCTDCRLVAGETHPDFHIIHRQLIRDHPDPEIRKRKGLGLGVEVIRNFVIDRVALTPHRGRAKVFIIRDAEEMNTQAQNALLKTLEEPPGTTFLILPASSLDALLHTTQSRCQVVRFEALPEEFVRQRLAQLRPKLSHEELAWYTRTAGGSLGEAIENADYESYAWNNRVAERLAGERLNSVELYNAWSEVGKAVGEHFAEADPDVTEAEAARRGLRLALRITANWYADVLRSGVGSTASAAPVLTSGPSPEDGVVNSRWERQIATQGKRLGAERAASAIQRVVEAEQQLDFNVNTQLCLETLAAELANLHARGALVPA